MLKDFDLRASKNEGNFPKDFESFGYWIAGLMESDGCFGKSQWTITAEIRDWAMLENIAALIGGKVYAIKGTNGCELRVFRQKDITLLFHLCIGKLRDPRKQFMMLRILNSTPSLSYLLEAVLPVDESKNLHKTHWLSGFTTGDGCFLVLARLIQTIFGRPAYRRVQLRLEVTQKKRFLLDQISEAFGGNVHYKPTTDSYSYHSSSIGVATKLVNYFDNYSLCGMKFVNYQKWRSVWTLMLSKQHLTDEGFAKIVEIRQNMNDGKAKPIIFKAK